LSEYTREEILRLIEEKDGPWGLDLSGKDLSGIDLSREAIEAELEKVSASVVGTPLWCHEFVAERAYPGGTIPLGVNLLGANLQEVVLAWANLQGGNLVGANLQGAYLREADLQGADLELADLQGADLVDTNLQGANLFNADLQGAYLVYADLQGANLMGANLQEADLGGANLQEADLSYSHLERVDLFDSKSLEGVCFYKTLLDDTQMRGEKLGKAIGEELVGKYDDAKEAYLALKNNFADIGRYRDESWAYVKERQMEKKMNYPRLAREYYGEELPENPKAWQLGWFCVRHTVRWALDRGEEWTCDYGESVPKTLRAMGVALVGFAILYWLLGAVVDVSGNSSSSWLHCLLYSGGAFTTFGVDTLRPANDWIRALSIFESAVGIALTGLLGFVLGNRIRRS
jgi:uncharacterized protein YjbI with pentapeptide repeats